MPSPIEFAHLQIPLNEVVKATNNFANENLIGQGGFGKVYRGTLSWMGQSIDIVARRLHRDYGQGDIEFWTEIMMLARFNHKNVVSIVGFCDENDEKIIINKHVAMGSLDKHLSSPTLTWMQRLQICVDVAHALRYIHNDVGHDMSVIHRNVKSSKILLDENRKPKLSGFEVSLKNARARRHRILLAEVIGTIGYIDPTYEKSGFVTHKSDVYSLGAVLLEVLCGRRAFIPDEEYLSKHNVDNRTTSPFSDDVNSQGSAFAITMTTIKKLCSISTVLTNIGLLCDNGTRSPTSGAQQPCDDEQCPPQFAIQSYTEGKQDEMTDSHLRTNALSRPWNNWDSRHSWSSGDEQKMPLVTRELSNPWKLDIGQPSSFTNVQPSSFGQPSSFTNVHPSSFGQPSSFTNVQPSSFGGQPSSFTNVQPSSFGGQPSSFTNVQPSSFGQPSSFTKVQLSSSEHQKQSTTHNELPTEASSLREQRWMLHPLFTMKKLDQYKDSPNKELLAQLAKSYHEEGNLSDLIDQGLWKQMNPESFNIFLETAFSCLKEQRSQRPNIDQVVIKLERALELQRRYENLDHSRIAAQAEATSSSNQLKGRNLEKLEIPLFKIKLATKNFTETYLGSGTYGKVYKAELDLPNKGELYNKIKRTVAIKRILIREDKQGKEGFITEIDLLTNCKHPNIVSLLGFCHEGSHMILVYEYVRNGSLGDYLGSADNLIYLTWAQRIKICIDIARGLNYLHTRVEGERRIVHRDIKSDNILLGKNWEAKIADFGLSRFYPEGHEANTLYTDNIAGTNVYLDPEYQKFGKLKKAVDIYSFGVVLFEILSGKIANDPVYMAEDNKGLAPVARRHFKEGKINKMVDPKIMEEVDELNSTLNKGPNQDSLNTFTRIAYQCLSETQNERPTAEVIIEELEKALSFQENHKDNLQISLKDIKVATENFSDSNRIGGGGFGIVYKGELTHATGPHSIVAKRLDKRQGQGEHEFLTELEVLFEYKHENIIGLIGYCNEKNEKIIVYEHASKGSLDKHLRNMSLTWKERLQICIDVASGLAFLHGGALTKEIVIHRDIKTANILLNDDWKAKISDFGLSLIIPVDQEMEYVISKLVGTIGYVDPLYESMGFLTKESDIYSFGVVLFEIMYGGLLVPDTRSYDQQRVTRMLNYIHDEGKLDWIVLYGIRKQMATESLSTFLMIVGRCLDNDRKKRPTAEEVLQQLKEALEYQEDYEIWGPKLPKDYKDIIQMSKSPEIYSAQKKKNLCSIFSKGIHLQEDKVWFSLGSNGERNKMISASEFSYISDRSPPEWQSIPESKFKKVAEMSDTTNLMIKIEAKTDLLSPNVTHAVHLLFKFCDLRKVSSKPVYVNLKYKKGSETLHAYFATWRDDDWMTIELCRFLNHKEETTLTFLLESFSTYYCGDEAIYVEGIEFRAIQNVKHEEIEQKNDIHQVVESDMNVDQVQQLPTN